MPIKENLYRTSLAYWLLNGLTIGILWMSGQVGLLSAVPPEWQSMIWPPTGIALAILLTGGYRFLPGVLLGTFLLHLTSSQSVSAAFIIALGSGVAAAAGTFLLRAFDFRHTLPRLIDAYRLILLAGIISTLINATLDTAGILVSQNTMVTAYGIFWLRSWQSHFLGVILFTPLFLVWINHPPTRFSWKKIAESIILMALLILIALIIYVTGTGRIAYLPFPFIIWAAFRLERRGTLLISTLIIAIAITLTVSGVGVRVEDLLAATPDAVWFFMCAATMTAVTVSIANHERQQTKMCLQEERDFALQVMKQLGQGVTITGPDGKFEFVNNAFAHMIGYEPHETINCTVDEFPIPEDVHLLGKMQQSYQAGVSVSHEIRLRHRTGAIIHTLVTSVPRFQEGQRPGAIAVFTDLTERKKAEQKLRQSEQRFKNLFTAANRQSQELALLARLHAALARELDPSRIYASVVDALADTFGYHLVSLHIRQGDHLILQHQRGFTEVRPNILINDGLTGRVVRTGEPILTNNVHTEHDYIPPLTNPGGGSEICVPLFNESEVVGVLNIESTQINAFTNADLTLLTMLSEHVSVAIERTHLYEKVVNNEKRFRALIEHNPASITLVDENGYYIQPDTKKNTYWAQKRGHAFDEAVIHPNDLEMIKAAFAELLNEPGASRSLSHRVQTLDGSIGWVEKTFTNLLHEPTVQAIVINARDITERKQAEEALRQAQKLDSLGILAGGIAHDFNNLLVAMMGQISLAQIKSKSDSAIQPHLRKAYIATEKAGSLTRQLLAYSGHGQFQIESINLNHLIQENMHLFTVGLPKSVQITSDLYEPLPLIKTDVGQMQQVIMNLIINGAEAIGEQGGTVSIITNVTAITPRRSRTWPSFGIAPQPGSYVTLSIADNGSGMDEATLVRIFDPFFTTKFTGRGLGLAAVQGIIRGHSGGLTVTSKKGKGSKFDIFFPVHKIVARQEKSVKENAAGYSISVPQVEIANNAQLIPNGTILVIDDEASVRDTLADILSSEAWQVITAVNGHDGIHQFRLWSKQIKLIILDLSMPGMNVEEIITQLRTIQPDIPILLSSGYSETEVKQRMHDLNVAGFLQKPYNVDKLVAHVSDQFAVEE